MKLYYNWFKNPDRFDFQRMKEVFDYSLRRHNVNIEIVEERSEYPDRFNGLKPSHFENIFKLRQWNDFVQKLTEPAFLTDCDMLCTGDISCIEAEAKGKDVWFTTRAPEITNVRCNAGVVYVKPTEKAKKFFRDWLAAAEQFDTRQEYWSKMLAVYKGATQTALAHIWDENSQVIGELPCLKWNATVFEWRLMNPDEVKFIHIKSNLRLYILENFSYTKMGADREYLMPIQQLWYDYENAMKAAQK